MKPFKKFTEIRFHYFPQEAAAICIQQAPIQASHTLRDRACVFSATMISCLLWKKYNVAYCWSVCHLQL